MVRARIYWLILPLLSLGMAMSGQTIRIVAADSTAPFAPLVEDVIRAAGLIPAISFMPQARLLGTLVDFDAAFFVTDDAIMRVPGMTKVPIPLAWDEFVAITVDPGIRVAKRADLRGYRVGIVRGSMIAARATEGLDVPTRVDNPVTLLKMLGAKRFDVALLHRELLRISAVKANIGTYYVQEPALLNVPLYFALTESGAAFGPRVTKAFQGAVDDGSWARALGRIAEEINR